MENPLRPPAGLYNRRYFLKVTAAGVVTVLGAAGLKSTAPTVSVHAEVETPLSALVAAALYPQFLRLRGFETPSSP